MLEKYEWDNTWIEQTDKKDAYRVLYIGDSISYGTRTALNRLSGGKLLFDSFSTSKALDNPFYFKQLLLFAEQLSNTDAVIFNNGLHGWHLSEQEYKMLYGEFIDKLTEGFKGVSVIPVLTTFVTHPDYHNDRVKERNKIVKGLALERGLDVINLYPVAEANRHLLLDGVHFPDEGYDALARVILSYFDSKRK